MHRIANNQHGSVVTLPLTLTHSPFPGRGDFSVDAHLSLPQLCRCLFRRRGGLFVGLLVIFFCANVFAQSYPAKSIRVVVPFPPGAFNDTLGRTIAQKFVETGFAQAVVDNRPGAGSTIGTDIVAKAPGDGYTLLGVAVPFAVNATLYARLPYDTLRDFTGIIHAGGTPNMLVMHPSVPVVSIKELIALAKAKPNQLNYASTGTDGCITSIFGVPPAWMMPVKSRNESYGSRA